MAESALKRIARMLTTPGPLTPHLATVHAHQDDRKSWPFAGLETSRGALITTGSIDLLDGLGAGSYERIYRTQNWVTVCVKKISVAAASLPFKAYGRFDGGGRDRLPQDHPLARLIANPYTGAGPMMLVGAICRDIGVYDNALVIKAYDNGPADPPTQLWPVDWRRVEIIPGETEPVIGFRVSTTSGKSRLFRRDECIHFQLNGGLSPLEPLGRTLILEDAAQRVAIAMHRNGFRASVWAQATQQLTEEQKLEFKRLLAAYQGPEGAGGVPLLPSHLSLNNLDASNAKDSEWVAARKLNREEVAAAYSIDPTQIGILDRATFNNVQEAHLGFYMDTLRPWLAMIEEAFRVQMLNLDGWDDTFLEFDMSDVLKGNIEQRSEAYQRFLQSGVMTPNELRRLENLPPVDDRGADSVHVPMNMTALDGRIPSPAGSPVGQPALAAAETRAALVDALAAKALAEPVDNEGNQQLALAIQEFAKAVADQPAPVVNVDVAPPDVNVNVRPPEKARTVVFPDGRKAEITLDQDDDTKQTVTFSDGRSAEINKED
jgi:HK97 family phage portal protein